MRAAKHKLMRTIGNGVLGLGRMTAEGYRLFYRPVGPRMPGWPALCLWWGLAACQ